MTVGFESIVAAKRLEIDAGNISDSDAIDDLIPALADAPADSADAKILYLEGISSPEKVLQKLKEFGGKPKLANPVPQWLGRKLSDWSLQRHQESILRNSISAVNISDKLTYFLEYFDSKVN
jgi:hypothetical protein